jgi:NADPH:quinone reductase-like Zn-dependent oxidoreductase
MGAYAEYVNVAEENLARVPSSISLEEAASIPIAGLTAWHALVTNGKVQPGQKVLINGASGGVGTFAVQIAHALGAEVTGVCSTRNVEMVRRLGADHVIDYTRDNFTTAGKQYDLILDNVANHRISQLKKVMKPGALCLIIGYFNAKRLFTHMFGSPLASLFGKKKFSMLDWKLKAQDLEEIGKMIDSGKIKPEIDRRYPLEKLPEAMAYVEEGHARGKVVVILKEEK